MKKFILGVIIGGIVFGTITGVIAYSYNAKNISYTPNDSSWNVETVEDALKDLKTTSVKDVKPYLDKKENFGVDESITYNGFIVGHKYLGLYTSNYWAFDDPPGRIDSGVKDVNIIASAITAQRVSGGGKSYSAIITFEATADSITLYYGQTSSWYSMRFIDITN